MIAVALILGQGALCLIGLRLVRSFGAYTEEQRQFRLVLNDSMLLLHQYYVAAHPPANVPHILPNQERIA